MMADNVNDYDNISIFKNVMIVDDLFKANGHLYTGCISLYEDCFDDNIINGFHLIADNKDDYDKCSFMIEADEFRFVVDQKSVFFVYGSLCIEVGLVDGSGYESSEKVSDISSFKKIFLLIINLQSKSSFETLDQFIDEYNCKHMTHV